MNTEQYVHHDKYVTVVSELKGKHRKVCLCWECTKFHPGIQELNCPIAKKVFELCVVEHLVLPVVECPEFKQQELCNE